MQAPTSPQAVSVRAIAAVLLFVLCCLLSSGHMAFQALNLKIIGSDQVSKRSDQRFAALKAKLPTSGVIGYIGEPGDSATPDYYLTQYALAPLVVAFSSNHPVVVGNFPSSPPPQVPPNLRLVQDFGNGVLLLAARDAQ